MPTLSRVANTLRANQVIVSVLWLGLLGAPVAYAVPNPVLTGPIPVSVPPGDPSHNYPFLATILIPPDSGYIEQEFFMEGTANHYSTSCAVVPCPPESSLSRGTVVSSGYPYKVRMVVRRPSDLRKFNGRVIVEWLNVTNNFELDVQWYRASEYFIRLGYAYVGVGPQRAGIHGAPNGLIAWSPGRYGTLDVTAGGTITDDSLKWDIFSQAGQAIAKPAGVDPLGSLPGRRLLIATGDSQSSSNLATYLNAVHPLDPIYSGFVLGGPLGVPIRADAGVKVFKVISEWDLVVFEAAIRQPDTAQYVAWEVAGSSHSDYHNFVVNSPVRLRDVGVPGILPDTTNCIDPARSRVHLYLVHQAAYDWMARWLLRGKQPPSMPEPIEVDLSITTNPPGIVRDRFGIALGGIRLADVSVPVALNDGWNTGGKPPTTDSACQQAGTYIPFDDATLDALYPTHRDYVEQVEQVTRENVSGGFLLRPDGRVVIEEARRPR